jgi:hypothetical protein
MDFVAVNVWGTANKTPYRIGVRSCRYRKRQYHNLKRTAIVIFPDFTTNC